MAKSSNDNNLEKYSAPALENGMAVLELLSTESGLSLTDISKRIDLTRTSVFRILAVLRRLGYVEYSTKYRLYRLSHKMYKISHQDLSVDKITSTALPVMKELSETINESCYISFYSQGGILVMARQEPEKLTNALLVRVGSDHPLLGNCAGHIILTFASDEEREEMTHAARSIRGDIIKNDAGFKKMLARISEQGYEMIPSPTLEGVVDIAFPIFNQLNQLAGTVSVSCLKHVDQSTQLPFDKMLTYIRETSLKISANIGHDPENN